MFYHKTISQLRDFSRVAGVRFAGLTRKALFGKLQAMVDSGRYPRLCRHFEQNGETYVEAPAGFVVVKERKSTGRKSWQRCAKISGPDADKYNVYVWHAPPGHANA